MFSAFYKRCEKNLYGLLFLFFTLNVSAQDLFNLTQLTGGKSKAVTSADPDPNSNMDRLKYIMAGETKTIAEIDGPGIINHIWLTFSEARPNWLEANGSARPDEIILRMYWDGSSEPAVEAPLGDFFAAGFGERLEVKSIPVQVEGGDGYNCYWAMPFFKHAKITVTNEGKKNVRSFYYHIDYSQEKSLPEKTAYFCAQYKNEFPEKTGKDYLVLDATGEGQYVGTVMSARSRSPEWFGEGDAKFYVDGDKRPTIQGTGTEDYFLMAWGMSPTQFPYYGCNHMSAEFGDLGVQYSMYRWHIADPIKFNQSLRFEIEHTGWISADETESGNVEGHVEREDDIATVAFWYQVGQPKRFTKLPPLAMRMLPNLDSVIEGKTLMTNAKHSPAAIGLQKGYDWTGDGQIFFQPAGSATPVFEAEFNISKEEYRGLLLRFTYSEDYGIYRIFLDGKDVQQPADYVTGQSLPGFDFYSKEMLVKNVYVGSYKLAPGKHTIRMECIGRNPMAKANYLGFDSIRLRERWNKKRKLLK